MPYPLYTSILELIGDTPLVRLTRVDAKYAEDNPETRRAVVWAKCEQLEPGGSVKDRIALAMIEDAETRGLLQPGGTVIEPTSGNTGIALAMVCAVKGYRCLLTMPASMSLERRQLLEALGAEVVLTPPELQMQGAIDAAEQLATKIQGSYLPKQFDNPANPAIHAQTTAHEIMYALQRDAISTVDAVVVTAGTTGTITGLARTFKATSPPFCSMMIAVEPARCATLLRGERGPTKIQGLAPGFVPSIFDRSLVDEIRTIDDDDAFRTSRMLAHREGLLVGISSGAAVAVALQVAYEIGPQHHVVTLLCDTGERYFSLNEHFKPIDNETYSLNV